MTALAKDLAEGQNLQVSEKVISLQKSENGIQISCESGRVLTAQKVVLTCRQKELVKI